MTLLCTNKKCPHLSFRWSTTLLMDLFLTYWRHRTETKSESRDMTCLHVQQRRRPIDKFCDVIVFTLVAAVSHYFCFHWKHYSEFFTAIWFSCTSHITDMMHLSYIHKLQCNHTKLLVLSDPPLCCTYFYRTHKSFAIISWLLIELYLPVYLPEL